MEPPTIFVAFVAVDAVVALDAVPVILATVNVAVDGLNEIPAFANTVRW